jgi:hypothetical protein
MHAFPLSSAPPPLPPRFGLLSGGEISVFLLISSPSSCTGGGSGLGGCGDGWWWLWSTVMMWEAADVVAGRSAGGGLWQFFFIVCIISLSCVKLTRQRNVHSFFKLMHLVCRALNTARQSAFAVRATKSARQRFFTVQKGVVWLLPCVSEKNAQQRVCRAFLALCCAPETHGKGSVSVVIHQYSIYD